MKKIDLGQTITIFANVGVIAGIVFLAMELRQNTAAVRLSAAQYLASEQAEINKTSLDAGIWAGRCRQMVRIFDTAEFLETWRLSGHMFGNDFRDYVEAQIIPGSEDSC